MRCKRSRRGEYSAERAVSTLTVAVPVVVVRLHVAAAAGGHTCTCGEGASVSAAANRITASTWPRAKAAAQLARVTWRDVNKPT